MVLHTCPCGYETSVKPNFRRHQESSRCTRFATKPLEVMQARLEAQETKIRDLQDALTNCRSEKNEEIKRLHQQNEQLTKALGKGAR